MSDVLNREQKALEFRKDLLSTDSIDEPVFMVASWLRFAGPQGILMLVQVIWVLVFIVVTFCSSQENSPIASIGS